MVQTRGSDTLNPRSASRVFADVGAEARLEWNLTQRIAIEFDAGCIFPLWQDRFLFGPKAFHRVAWIGGLAALGFSLRFP
jgi:hypothetical protein